MKQLLGFTALVIFTLISAQALAAGAVKDSTPPQDGKLDVTDLEHKYWSAKDTDFSVVQNRLFNKTGRLALTLDYGMYANDPWSTGPTYSASLAYYFSERYGMELNYATIQSRDNDATANLKQQQGGAPNHNDMKGFYGASFDWVPFYAKISVLNSSIIYFDMSISPGLGMTTYEQQLLEGGVTKTAPTATLAITQHFFLNKYLALRIDYKNFWFNEDVTQYRAPVAGRTTTSDINSTGLIMFGVTLYH